jgi:hypothetical protein
MSLPLGLQNEKSDKTRQIIEILHIKIELIFLRLSYGSKVYPTKSNVPVLVS